MTDILLTCIWPAAAGFALGLFFFGGLWLTIRLALRSPHSGLWFSLSLLLRLLLTCAAMLYVAAASPQRLLLCGGGFLVARLLLTRILPAKGGQYAYKP